MSGPDLGLRPLTARSVILSVLLGSHPPVLPVQALVRTGELFGISDGTTRVALSRLAADGDVTTDDAGYRLSPRLLRRQARQDESRRAATRRWGGRWEVAVAGPQVRSVADRAALGAVLGPLRLGELRPGVWTRPDNLDRAWPADLASTVLLIRGRPVWSDPTPADLVARLWDLEAWSDRARALAEALESEVDPATCFVVAAAVLRHLGDDPLLPSSLLPAGWPGDRLRAAYAAYAQEFAGFLRRELVRHVPPDGAERSTS